MDKIDPGSTIPGFPMPVCLWGIVTGKNNDKSEIFNLKTLS